MATRTGNKTGGGRKPKGNPSLAAFEAAARAWGEAGAAAVTVSISGKAPIVVAVTTDAGTRLLSADDLGQVYGALCETLVEADARAAAALGLPPAEDKGKADKAPRPAPGDRGGWQ